MPRPFKCRHIGCKPRVCYFKPRGIPLTALGEVVLTVDEFEAVRLADLEGMYQDDGAKKMKVSRQTFGNIVNAARNKIADALVHGKSLEMGGCLRRQKGICPKWNGSACPKVSGINSTALTWSTDDPSPDYSGAE